MRGRTGELSLQTQEVDTSKEVAVARELQEGGDSARGSMRGIARGRARGRARGSARARGSSHGRARGST